MSHGARPPNNPYGDKDFVSEGNLNSQPGDPNRDVGFHSNLNRPPLSDYPQQPYNRNSIDAQTQLKLLNQTITQEDLLFMRTYRRDTFYGKTLPTLLLGAGALYFYRRHKGLGQKTWHYVAVGAAASVTGPVLNRHEFLRRLENERSNSPFMEALRKMFGVERPISEMEKEASGELGAVELTDWSSAEHSFGTESNSPKYGSDFGQNLNPSNLEPEGQNSSKKLVSYDELRAKNRGYTR